VPPGPRTRWLRKRARHRRTGTARPKGGIAEAQHDERPAQAFLDRKAQGLVEGKRSVDAANQIARSGHESNACDAMFKLWVHLRAQVGVNDLCTKVTERLLGMVATDA
jgi:hypothetical protein